MHSPMQLLTFSVCSLVFGTNRILDEREIDLLSLLEWLDHIGNRLPDSGRPRKRNCGIARRVGRLLK